MKTSSESKDWKSYQGNDRVVSSHELMTEHEARGKPGFRVKCDLPSLNAALDGGFEGGELYAVSGLTKHGKTTLCQSLTWQFLKQQRHSLWFTFEVAPIRFLQKYKELPTIYMPRELKPYALTWIDEKIEEAFQKYHTRIVFIDHLHFLFDLARTKNTSLEIGRVIRHLKQTCVNKDIVIFLLCHTQKVDPEGDIGFSAIRDSSFVAQESDSVFMIQRDKSLCRNGTGAKLFVEFHRRTGVMRQEIHLQMKDGLFVEIEEGE